MRIFQRLLNLSFWEGKASKPSINESHIGDLLNKEPGPEKYHWDSLDNEEQVFNMVFNHSHLRFVCYELRIDRQQDPNEDWAIKWVS